MQIKLLTLDTKTYFLEDQIEKIAEEFSEVCSEYEKDNIIRLAEESIDLMQCTKTLLQMIPENIVRLANNKHIAKLKQRAAEGKIKLLEDEE